MRIRAHLLLIAVIVSGISTMGEARQKRSHSSATSLADLSFGRWVEFEAPDKKFRILFPGVATMKLMGDEEYSETPKRYFAVYQSKIKYTIMSYEYPENLESAPIAKDVFDSTRDSGTAASAQAGEHPRIVSEIDENYEGHPARILEISMSGGRTTWCKSIVIGNHFYFMEVVFPPPDGRMNASMSNEKIARFFFNSFHPSSQKA